MIKLYFRICLLFVIFWQWQPSQTFVLHTGTAWFIHTLCPWCWAWGHGSRSAFGNGSPCFGSKNHRLSHIQKIWTAYCVFRYVLLLWGEREEYEKMEVCRQVRRGTAGHQMTQKMLDLALQICNDAPDRQLGHSLSASVFHFATVITLVLRATTLSTFSFEQQRESSKAL